MRGPRFGLMSDVHGNLPALRAVQDALGQVRQTRLSTLEDFVRRASKCGPLEWTPPPDARICWHLTGGRQFGHQVGA